MPLLLAKCVFVIALLTAVLGACGPTAAGTERVAEAGALRVGSIVDGDTIVVTFPGRGSEPVRLLGIDTPESVDRSRPEQCYGSEATARITELIPPGTPILLEVDIESRDRYGRLLAYVYRADDGLFVNAVMLGEGLADVSIYEPNSTHADELRRVATVARTANVGLWSACGGPDVAVDPPAPNAG